MSRARLTQFVAEISTHPSVGPLASRALALAQQAWKTGDLVFPRPGSVTLVGSGDLQRTGVQCVGMDLEGLLVRGAMGAEELDALTALVLIGASASWPANQDTCRQLARNLLWLETYTGLHCLTFAGMVFDESRQRQIAEAVLSTVESVAPDEAAPNGPERRIGLAWLGHCLMPHLNDVAERARQLSLSIDESARSMLRGDAPPLVGVLGPRPRSDWVVFAFAVTGLLFLLRFSGAVAKWVLFRRIPTSIWLSERGLELFARYELLGRVVRERRIVVPMEEIRTVEREVRFPRFGLYSGLIALAIGTFLGTRMFVDGLRVSGLSLPLVGIGVLLVVVGVALDLALSAPGVVATGQCRLVVTPVRGRSWAIGALETANVDRLLDSLATRLAARRP